MPSAFRYTKPKSTKHRVASWGSNSSFLVIERIVALGCSRRNRFCTDQLPGTELQPQRKIRKTARMTMSDVFIKYASSRLTNQTVSHLFPIPLGGYESALFAAVVLERKILLKHCALSVKLDSKARNGLLRIEHPA